MIVLRALQGFAGGVMIPLAFTIVMTMLPRSKHAIGLAGFAVTATFAPAIGPTIGGYFTDNYGWPWIFYINLVPGAVMLAALWYGLPKSAMQFGLLRRGDWRGIALMAVGLAALQTVLDDGNVYDWFGSPFIVKLSLVAAVALGAFVVLEFITPAAAGQFPAARPAQFRPRDVGQLPARLRALRFRLSVAPIPRRHARLRFGADRRGHGLDRAAAAAVDPAGAAVDEAVRCALAGRHRPADLCRQLLYEHGARPELRRRRSSFGRTSFARSVRRS